MGKKKKIGKVAEKPEKKPSRSKIVLIEFHDDELLETAARLAHDKQSLSTALIQRTLVTGYARAAHLIDRLEDLGVVGPQDGSKPRKLCNKPPALKRKPPPVQEKKADTPKRGRGRPTVFSPEVALTICNRISHGESLRQICKDDEMPGMATVIDWLLEEEKEMFHRQYRKARDIQAEVLVDEMLEIADDSTNDWVDREVGKGRVVRSTDHEHVNRSRLRVDTRKWYASKVIPKKYGDKLDLTTGGEKLKPSRPAVINYVVPNSPEAK